MATLLDDMAFLLDAAGLVDIDAVSTTVPHVHLGQFRDAPNRLVGLITLPGSPPEETFGDGSLPIMERPRLQVFCRHDPEDYVAASALAWSVWKALAAVANETVNGTWYQRVVPVDSPAVFDRDGDNRVVFVFNCSVWKALP